MREDKIVYRVFNDFLFEYRFNVMQGKHRFSREMNERKRIIYRVFNDFLLEYYFM